MRKIRNKIKQCWQGKKLSSIRNSEEILMYSFGGIILLMIILMIKQLIA